LIVLAIAAAYVRFGALPAVQGVLYGVKPVVIAVVLQAIWGLGRTALKSRALAVIGAASVALVAANMDELVILLGAGVAALGWYAVRHRTPGDRAMLGLALQSGAPAAAAGATGFGLVPLFLVFLKIGSVLYGSGYVLVAFLRADLVARLGWLTEGQLLDAVAVGQVTPGPVFTTATFVGYVLGGTAGAVVATVGIFLPAFVFVAASGPLVAKARTSVTAGAFIDGVNVASLALMATVTVQLARAAVVDPATVVLGLASAVLLLRYRVNSAWLVLGGALVGTVVDILTRR
jgi:chromate transporter